MSDDTQNLLKICNTQLSTTTSPVPSDQQGMKMQSQLFINLLYLKYFKVFGRYLPTPMPNSLLPIPGHFAFFLPSFLVQEGGINPEEMSYLQTSSC